MEQLNGQRIEIKIPLDDNGYFDRKCPDDKCGKYFKVKFEDWKSIVRDEAVYCPICRHEEPATEWNTEEQQEYIKQSALNAIKDEFSQAMAIDAQRFNAKQKRGFINISLSYKPGQLILPISPEVLKELEHNYRCNRCNCHYSYFGTAYFCPSCGTENVEGSISESIRNIRLFTQKEKELKQSYSETFTPQETESIFSQILEDNFCKIVSLFQKYTETLFAQTPGSAQVKVRKNAFQNLDESSQKWKELKLIGYEDIFEAQKYPKFKEYFQIRHLFAHNGGVVDQSFMEKIQGSYTIGQRIIINSTTIEDFLNITEEFIEIISTKLK